MNENNVSLTASRLTKNSATSVARFAITIPILFLITPFILHKLGTERFGVWAIFSLVTSFADLSDLGIASGLIRYIAKYWVAKDKRSINSAVSTILAVYLLTGGLVVVSVILLRQTITARFLNIPPMFMQDAIIVIMGAVIAFFISLIFGIFGSLLQGLQRLELWNTTLLVDTVLNGIGAVVVLSLGYGLRELVICRVIVSLLSGLLNLLFTYRVLPSLNCRLSNFNWTIGREIVSYSLNILVSKITSVARDPLNKIILLWVNSLAGVTFFDLGGRIANQARGLFSAMLIPLLPASSGIHTVGGDEAIHNLFYRVDKYLILLLFPVFGGLIIFATPLINLWLGPGYEMVALTMQILLISNLFSILATPAYSIMEGIGFSRLNAFILVFSSLLSIGLGVGLGMAFGYTGVLAGLCFSQLVASGLEIFFFHRKVHVPLGDSLRSIPLKPMLFDILFIVATGILVSLGHVKLVGFAIYGTAYVLLCIIGNLMLGSIGREEIKLIKSILFSFR